jgi:protein phosphatase 1 regulatory subunit 7
MQEGITFIDNGNGVLRQLSQLKKLDLSFNKISRIDNLECLKELRELNLSYNRIEEIHPNIGKIVNLRVVNLNHNKIRRLENLKNCRKLEVLQVGGNALEDLNVYGTAQEPLLELRELHAERNKIQVVKASLSLFPNVRHPNAN